MSKYDVTTLVKTMQPRSSVGFAVTNADNEHDGSMSGSVEKAVEITDYIDESIEAVRAAGVDESQYEDVEQSVRRKKDRNPDATYQVDVAVVRIDTDADPDDPDRREVELTDEARDRLP